MENSAKDTILIGDQVTLKFRSNILKGEKFVFPDMKNPVTEGVELISQPITDTISVDGNSVNLESRVVVTSFDSGSYKLPSFTAYKFKIDGTVDTLNFEGGELEVTTIQIDTSSFQPFEVKDQMNYPFTIKEVMPWVGIILFVMLLLLLITRTVKKIRERKSLFGKGAELEPPHIIALKKLESLREQKLWQKNQKEFFTNVTDILREYLEFRFEMQAMEKTSNEILSELSVLNLDKEVLKQLSELFRIADFVKFAKHSAETEECEHAVPMAVRFINSVYVRQIEEEKEAEEKENKPKGGV
ncbi:MAG: hypothetical protein AB7S40_04975 [Bacteroidales bacterium]